MISQSKQPRRIRTDNIRGGNSIADIGKSFSQSRESHRQDVLARYKGADQNRFTRDMRQTRLQGSAADYHYATNTEFFRLQEISRDIDRNDAIAGHAIDTLVNNVMQGGFQLDPNSGSPGVDSYIKDRWEEFTEEPSECDFEGEKDFNEIAKLSLRQQLIDGDHFLIPLDDGRLQSIESHRVRTPYGNLSGDNLRHCIHGVQLDEYRGRTRYYVAQDDIDPFSGVHQNSDFAEFEAFNQFGDPNVFHNYHPKRSTQTRGVTIYAPIVQQVGLLDDVQFAKLVQQQGVSVWIAAIERMLEGEYPDDEPLTSQNSIDDICSPGQLKALEDVAAGMVFRGHPGETMRGFSPNVPNPTYFDHAKQIMELIAVNIGLPYIVLMMDASETNFTGWRGAMEMAKIIWRDMQKNQVRKNHRKTYRFKMRQWTTPGSMQFDPFLYRAYKRGADVFRSKWSFPAWPYVQPMEEVTANALEVSKAQNSPRRVQARQGRDYYEVIVGELIDDNFALIDRAMDKCQELRKKYPDQDVTWERLVSVGAPDNVNLNTTQAIQDEDEEEDDSEAMLVDAGEGKDS